jgi:CHAD domain-containing protein
MARLALTPQLDHLLASVEAARATLDAEAIHQVRVTSRRLRVFLVLAGVPVLQSDLRWLAGALSRVRDLDVVADSALGERGPFAEWLGSQRTLARAEAMAVLRHPRLEGLLQALATVEPVRRRAAVPRSARLDDAVETAWVALERAEETTQALEALHRVRRRARAARYAREWLELDVSEPRRLQEAAGAVCDVIALRALLLEFDAASPGRAVKDARGLEQTLRETLLPMLRSSAGR